MLTDEERLRKLEDRFLDGEITEETYKELKERLAQRANSTVTPPGGSNDISMAHKCCNGCGSLIEIKCKKCGHVYCSNCRAEHPDGEILTLCKTCGEETVAPLWEEKRRKDAEEERKGARFEDDPDTVIDHKTGFMWQKSGSNKVLCYKDAENYIKKINQEKFAGKSDWRLPSLDEIKTLLEKEEKGNGLFIAEVFDSKRGEFWCSGEHLSDSACHVNFNYGGIYWNYLNSSYYVRAVRSC